jgi:DNA end-binding protein Ku
MAAILIERFTTSFDHAKYEDEYRDRLLDVVKRKHRGDDIHASPEPERDAPTELLEALRASVEAAKGSANGRTKKPSRKRRAKSKR